MQFKVGRLKGFTVFLVILIILQSWCFCSFTYAEYNRLMRLLDDSINLTVDDVKLLVEREPYLVKETYSDKNMKQQTVIYHVLCRGKNTLENRLAIVSFLIEKGASIGPMWESGKTPLHVFAEYGYIDGVRMILGKGVNPDCEDECGCTPLHVAAFCGQVNCVQLLLDRGANKDYEDKDGNTPLHWAAYRGYVDCVELLLDRGANLLCKNKQGKTPQQLALKMGYESILGLIESYCKNPDVRSVGEKQMPSKESTITPVQWMVQPSSGSVCASAENLAGEPAQKISGPTASGSAPMIDVNTRLKNAIFSGDFEYAGWLIDRGADKDHEDKNGWTPLHMAARYGHVDCVKLLLDRGADKDHEDKNGWTPLRVAAQGGRIDCVRLLLDRGADKDHGSKNGHTPLHAAAQEGKFDCVRLLLDRGANKDCENKFGNTPLHTAARYGHVDCVLLLIERGANPVCENKRGETPQQVARKNLIRSYCKNSTVRSVGRRRPRTTKEFGVTSTQGMVSLSSGSVCASAGSLAREPVEKRSRPTASELAPTCDVNILLRNAIFNGDV